MAAGKTFFKKKKQPIPVDLTGKDWAGQVRKATEATYMHHTGGTCINIRWAAASYPLKVCQAIFNLSIIVDLSKGEEIESEGLLSGCQGGAELVLSRAVHREHCGSNQGGASAHPQEVEQCAGAASPPNSSCVCCMHAC